QTNVLVTAVADANAEQLRATARAKQLDVDALAADVDTLTKQLAADYEQLECRRAHLRSVTQATTPVQHQLGKRQAQITRLLDRLVERLGQLPGAKSDEALEAMRVDTERVIERLLLAAQV